MNEASTRSHCIFTIHVMVREADSATIHRSKLHLVDLAGSERVSKTQAGGMLLREAKYINLSLHCLEVSTLPDRSQYKFLYDIAIKNSESYSAQSEIKNNIKAAG